MPRASWHLDRRTFLRGAGLSLALPWLEAMSRADAPAQKPKRFCAFFFGNGVALSTRNRPDQDEWHWFPHTDGADYRLNRSLEPLEPHRQDMTIFGGLSHPTSRLLVGHNTVDVWLTGADIRVDLQNSISIDQMIARQAARSDPHPLAGPVESRRRRHQEPLDHDLLRCSGPRHPRRVDAAPRFRTPVRAAGQR